MFRIVFVHKLPMLLLRTYVRCRRLRSRGELFLLSLSSSSLSRIFCAATRFRPLDDGFSIAPCTIFRSVDVSRDDADDFDGGRFRPPLRGRPLFVFS